MIGALFRTERKAQDGAATPNKATSAEPAAKASNDFKEVSTALPLSSKSPSGTVCRLIGHTLRTVLFDLPLLMVLLSYASVGWFQHVTDTYLIPQYRDMEMDTDRLAKEMTYYARPCDINDLSTETPSDLFLDEDASVDDAYQHQLKHGFTVFRQALQPETSKILRDYVVSRNYNLTEQEAIYVIENKNRYSFGLDTEVPTVAAAMKELTTHKLLRDSVEKILGPDPALIEMTAITIAYGAVNQWWHDDVIPRGSPVRHGRAFGPSYSIFVQLQNTTKEMGATSACPGTYYCSGGIELELCENHGYQVVNEEGHWAAGDALLMNMNSWHRGGAHTDPDAGDRVMLVLTFVPKPKDVAESRRMAQGITFSLIWSMWGHTWDDLAHADTRMTQPWATLKALGLYKSQGSNWGVDYITSASMRAIGSETGFDDDAMENFQKWGQLPWLPMFLEEQGLEPDEENAWLTYVTGTTEKVLQFCGLVVFCAVCGYTVLFALVGLFQSKRSWLRAFSSSLFRLSAFCALVYAAFVGLRNHVDSTQWAEDIRGHRRFTHTLGSELEFGVKTNGVTTFPHRRDVLIENRFGSSYLHLYNDYINGHPGNQHLLSLVDSVSPTFAKYPAFLQTASARYIAESVLMSHGRFLEQGAMGKWYLNDLEEGIAYTNKLLVAKSDPATGEVLQELRFMVSGYRVGKWRDTALAQKHMGPYLQGLEKKVVKASLKESSTASLSHYIRPPKVGILLGEDKVTILSFKAPRTKKVTTAFQISPAIQTPRSAATISVRTPSFKAVPTEPQPGAWFGAGSRVEAFTDGFWFIGTVVHVDTFGLYHVVFSDGDSGRFDKGEMRPFEPYSDGERLQVYVEGLTDYEDAAIVARMDDGTYHTVTHSTGEYFEDVEAVAFRRYHFDAPIEQNEYIRYA